jgi:glyoxylase-like metal-dependent hydrolase (beta-lactamase superfamily II)
MLIWSYTSDERFAFYPVVVSRTGATKAAEALLSPETRKRGTMEEQIRMGEEAVAGRESDQGGVQRIAPDLVYKRLAIVNVVFFGRVDAGHRGWVLIDTGIAGFTGSILRSAAARFGEGCAPAAIIMTHGHFDHVGSLEQLALRWDVPIYAHELELPYLNGKAAYPPPAPEVGGGLMSALSPLYPRGPVNVGRWLQPLPSDGTVPGMLGWRWIHTPGHTPGHISLWRENDRTLIAGDALITTRQESAYAVAVQRPELHGPPMYFTPDWERAKESVRYLAGIDPELVVSGHGLALHGPQLRFGLKRLADNFDEIALPRQSHYLGHPARAEDGSAYAVPR